MIHVAHCPAPGSICAQPLDATARPAKNSDSFDMKNILPEWRRGSGAFNG
jgi:hypothetical protein